MPEEISGLHVRVTGTGPDVVLVHGWAMHGGVFTQLVEALAPHCRVHCVDLPGHGHSDGCLTTPAALADILCAIVDRPAAWLGWSLGALAVLALARRHPRCVRALILVAGTPRFLRASDWPHALEPAVLEGFARELATDTARVLERFLTLQLRGVAGATVLLKRLRAVLASAPPARPEALAAGLAWLAGSDLRAAFAGLDVPVSVVLGERDLIVPAAVADDLARLHPVASLTTLEGAGHAPFFTHVHEVSTLVRGLA